MSSKVFSFTVQKSGLVAVIALLITAMAGCGSSESESTTSVPTTTDASATATSAPATTTTTAAPVITTSPPGIAPTQQQLIGMWETYEGYEVLHEDGSYSAGRSPEEARSDPIDFGRYTIEGNTFTYVTDPEAQFCTRSSSTDATVREGIAGVYEISISDDGNQLLRTLVDDECGARSQDVVPSVTRYAEED